MHVPFNLATALGSELRTAAAQAGWDAANFDPEVRTAEARHGDFQANGILPYAKSLRLNPRECASALVAQFGRFLTENFAAEIAGPGFINFRVKPAYLETWLSAYASESALRAGAADFCGQQTVVVDFSSPNTAKQLHVGHIRGMVIGEAICRLLEFCGATVIRDNHIGDWGTQFGKLIWAYKNLRDEKSLAADPLEELERLYKAADAATRDDPIILEAARRELVLLQGGDGENIKLWKAITALSENAFAELYQRLGIRFDYQLGESFYNDKLARVYEELEAAGISEESQGARVVFHAEHPRFREQPFIIRKSDGGANYASSDLATMLYRVEHFRANAIIVLTDARQTDHFEQLWLTVDKWFRACDYPLPRFEHLTFGSILGSDGKAIKTRTGEPIRLRALLDEAEDRAYQLVAEKSPDLPEDERRSIAASVGIGAIRYADLSQNRSSDYAFSWEKILSLEGNTAPYLLYAVARIHSVLRKSPPPPDPARDPGSGSGAPETPAETQLARKLIAFAPVLQLTVGQLRPHFLCTYLYELAGEFSAFYNAEKILVDDPAIRMRRIALSRRTLLVLETGLTLLGLRTLQRM